MKEAKEKNVHQVFEKIYKHYDKMNSIISFYQHKNWRKNTMKHLNVRSETSALDVCCGTGDLTLALAEAVGVSGEVIGLDFSNNMLSIATKKIENKNYDNVSLIHADAMNLPFPDARFDYVTIGFGLRNVPDYIQVLREMFRVLKPGGIAVCLETSRPSMFLYNKLYQFYFQSVMPKLGGLFGSYPEYCYLQQSTFVFPDKETLGKLFEQVGFINVQVKSFSGGVAAMHLGVKSHIWGNENGLTKNNPTIRND